MFRIYYDQQGVIERLVTAEYAGEDLNGLYIIVPDLIKIDCWRVNLETKELYQVEPPQYPTRPR